MNQLIKHSLGVAMMALMTTGSFAGGGYLPKIGPSTLRLQPKLVPMDVAGILPPLRMEDPKPVVIPPDESFIGPLLPEDPGPGEREMWEMDDLAGEPAPSASPGAGESGEPQQVPLTPQMFMRFFNQSGDREAVVQAPVEFTPPTPSRGSSARYIVK